MSSPNKAVEMQLLMRQNTEELQDFMRDLASWEKDIKKKDEELRKDDAVETETCLPPVRNKDYRKKKKDKRKIPSKPVKDEETKVPRIKSWDYQSWENFNVDKALETLDKEDSTQESHESDSEEDGIQIDTEKALAEKEKGNDFFKNGKYDDAIECYTRGMEADPYNPVLPTNRATCFFRLKKYAVAESDCNLAIALDRNYVKAYARRGAARFALKKFEDAKEDYEIVLKLDPENFEAITEIKKIDQAFITKVNKPEHRVQETNIASEMDEIEKKKIELQQAKQQAIVQKDLGNGYFKEGKYEAAIECYTKGIAADGSNAILPANRAMAYLKLEKYCEAENDCNTAITLDGSYSKAFARRGTARAAMEKLKEAKEDFEMVLKLEPGNKQARNEHEKIISKMTEIGLLPEECSEQKTEVTQPIIVQPIEKPFHKQSTKPLKRIKIEDVEDELLTNLPLRLNNPIELTLDPAEENITEGESKTLQTDSSSRFLKIEEIPNTEREILESDSTESHIEVHSSANVMRKAPDESIIGNTSLAPCLSVPPVPTNSFQLETDLRKLKDHPDMMYIYLKQIDPAHFPKLFQTSLEPDILNQILKVLHVSYRRHESPSLMLEVLKNLAQVKRFDMAIMFMSKEEKNVVKDLFNYICKDGLEEEAVKLTKTKYNV
ncbi:RNA polymerase II-associated protein 3 [Polypterus senegalus]|uniref:RNA polymerase II-associated protein 3 n=1 Tax=Polypterus senegalus TaxID=55291 RepID=UPI0019654649|nr:RNA polymerase II-associated protein 3 [Polypterus senegalus]XP_039616799.1 RNA polymerase II-associated protein 3 [Polypterus senegalus]